MITKASDVVVKMLLEAIIKGDLKPGDKVPTTQVLSQLSGTSIISAREAVQSLATIGILEISHGRGIFLSEGAPVVEELLEARKVIESHNAMVAAQKNTAENIRVLEAVLGEMNASLHRNDIESYSQKDIEFHFAIGMIAGNRILIKTLMNIRNLLRYQLFTINQFPKIMQQSSVHHTEIFEAIRQGDAEKARARMWHHMAATISSWKRFVASLRQE
ncbi:MAG: FCD domain-containing protein [Desulfobacteraceae bacterium]|nr:FCD domain-containing protein [Desulfobacteraceae bacterium]